MTKILENISLKAYNTFGIDVKAKFLCLYSKPSDLQYLINAGPLKHDEEMIILGGGSNQLFTGNFDGIVVHPVNDEIILNKETDDWVWLTAGAGLEWDKLVAYAVENGYGGIENLSNIPGNVGAAPVQNIGAYGVEAKDTIVAVHLVSFDNGMEKSILNEDCEFGYRTSIFKTRLKNRYLVDSVTFKLSKKPEFTLHYGSIKEELDKIGEVNLKTIRKTIIKTRESKLPDPKIIGNGGSFFKNPVLPEIEASVLIEKYPEMPTYKGELGMVKLAAGWLIEQCGLKGYTNENKTAGIHDKQALVLVNKGGATGKDIVDVAHLVQNKVFEKFDICLEPEVIIV
jgi:UDP-N-acetylmuramate dehydrogenase